MDLNKVLTVYIKHCWNLTGAKKSAIEMVESLPLAVSVSVPGTINL